MNQTFSNAGRQILKDLLAQCTDGQKLMFNRMYSHKKLEASIDEAVDGMDEDKISHAITQCERTVEKKPFNANFRIMATEVRFSFIQEIQTAHPLLLLQAEFYGTALIGEGEYDDIIIREVFVKDSFQPHQDNQRLAVTEMESQNMEGGEMGKFLGMCREAARKAAKT